MPNCIIMKKINKYQTTELFNNDSARLNDYDNFLALTKDNNVVHTKERPNMADIALYDSTTNGIITVRGYNYNAATYPADRYTPIGVVVVPKSHMDDGKARIMSLQYMRCDTPKIGGSSQYVYWGLSGQNINNMEYREYMPCINEPTTTNFGNTQEIKEVYSYVFFPSDNFNALPNPFTKNQYYYQNDQFSYYGPSPYDKNMNKNSIFFTNNLLSSYKSCLVNMNGKIETAKILAQLAMNIGNENWKNGETIENTDSLVNAPAAQCCWMYSTVGTNQGDWYLPTMGELVYMLAQYNAINKSITLINNETGNKNAILISGDMHSSSCYDDNGCMTIDIHSGVASCGSRAHDNFIRSFLAI